MRYYETGYSFGGCNNKIVLTLPDAPEVFIWYDTIADNIIAVNGIGKAVPFSALLVC